LATRPWSFTAAVVPLLITSAAIDANLFSISFIRILCLGIAVQAGANLTNTYYDFKNGVDNEDTAASGAGETTLVDKKVSPTAILALSALFYAVAFICALPSMDSTAMVGIFLSGIALAFFYTAKPVGLKYIALGDITIFMCFGPLLMQCASIVLSGGINHVLWVYSIPVGLLTEAILHANNARDIKADSAAGAVTLATLIGFEKSRIVFNLLFAGSYISVLYIGTTQHWGCFAALLSLPLARDVIMKYGHPKHMKVLPEEVAKMHLPFGMLFFLGIKFTSSGLI